MLQDNQQWVEMSPQWAIEMEAIIRRCAGREYLLAGSLRTIGGTITQIARPDFSEGVVLAGYQVDTPNHLVLNGDEMIRHMANGRHIMDKFQSKDGRFSGFFWQASGVSK